MICGARGDRIDCESESFSFSSVYGALKSRAERGAHVRLLVAARDVTARSAGALARLQQAGAEIRLGPDDEKMALAQGEAWLGSANATGGRPETIDWGVRTPDAAIIAGLRDRFEANWDRGRAFSPPVPAAAA